MIKFHRLCLLLALGLILPQASTAQIAYHHYLDSTFSWYTGFDAYVFSSPNCLFGGVDRTIQYRHIIGIDSLQGYWWYKIHTDAQSTEYCDMGPTTVSPPESSPYLIRIREDSLGRIWKLGTNGVGKLLYDFGQPIVIGDDIWMDDSTYACSVGHIDSVYFGQEARARYWCECDSNQPLPMVPTYLIEGVGSNKGIESPTDPCFELLDANQYTICARFGGSTILIDSVVPCGSPGHVIVGLEDDLENRLELWWNEAGSEMRVANWSELEAQSWKLYDLNGRQLLAGNHLSDRIPLLNLRAGMYIFTVEGPSSRKAIRFLKL